MTLRIRRRVGLNRRYFHVMNRGARKVGIYASDEDRRVFVSLLGRFAMKHEVQLISWCLVGNHFHFEPDTEGTPLSRMMHDLDGTYARYFNDRHDGSGCLFQGPFVSTSILGPHGLAYVSRYIHLNSLDVGAAPDTYAWSSCKSYLGLADVPPWLNPRPVWDYLVEQGWGRSPSEAYRAYLAAAPPRRPRASFSVDEVDDFYVEFVRFLEERCVERLSILNGELGSVPSKVLTSWAAMKVHKIPVRIVAGYFGYSSEGSVRNAVCKLQKLMDQTPGLAERILEGPRGLATPL